ncbi:MAG: hypothetical protein KJ915_03440 [Candidatus Omnitrophica bacterium]|nr:hypothetical protein [Candidatus Omnitrophota bacterium]
MQVEVITQQKFWPINYPFPEGIPSTDGGGGMTGETYDYLKGIHDAMKNAEKYGTKDLFEAIRSKNIGQMYCDKL